MCCCEDGLYVLFKVIFEMGEFNIYDNIKWVFWFGIFVGGDFIKMLIGKV